jgi:hypothetical protein
MLRPFINDQTASWLRRLHPHRLSYELLSDKNPFVGAITMLADQVRAHRRAVAPDNSFLVLQETASHKIVEALNNYRDLRDQFCESLFLSVYGSPLLQAAVGLCADAATARPRLGRDISREAAAVRAMGELEGSIAHGGRLAAVVRALVYIVLGKLEHTVDEQGFAVLRQIREKQPASHRLTLTAFKDLVRAQYLLLRCDEERALKAIPQMLSADASERRADLEMIHRIVSAGGDVSDEAKRRLARIEAMFKAREALVDKVGQESWNVASVQDRSPSRRRKSTAIAVRRRR